MDRALPPRPPGTPGRVRFSYTPVGQVALPAVAVVTPFFNTGAVFEQTRSALFGQSFQQWEWIIVNDGSDAPEALALLKELRALSPKIRVIDQPERRGPSAARNRAVHFTRAPYLLFLDSDDLLEPMALEKMLWCLESHPEWAVCKGQTVAFGEQSYLARAGFEQPWIFLDRNPITLTALIRRQVFIEIGGFDESMRAGLEDWDLWLRLAAHGYWGHTIPEPLDWYRRRHTHSDRWRLWSFRGVDRVRRRLRRAYPHLYHHGIRYISAHASTESASLAESVPFRNPLLPDRRLLLLLSPPRSTADLRPLERECSALAQQGYAVTVVFLGVAAGTLLRLTPEVFALANFLSPRDYVRFLLYLMDSRGFERVWVEDDPLCEGLVPFLQLRYPQLSFERLSKGDGSPSRVGLEREEIAVAAASPYYWDLARTLARCVLRCCDLNHHSRDLARRTPLSDRLSRHLLNRGRWGIQILLIKERLESWARRVKEKLFLRGRESSANRAGRS